MTSTLVLGQLQGIQQTQHLLRPINLRLLSNNRPLILIRNITHSRRNRRPLSTQVTNRIRRTQRLRPSLTFNHRIRTRINRRITTNSNMFHIPQVTRTINQRHPQSQRSHILKIRTNRSRILSTQSTRRHTSRTITNHVLLHLSKQILRRTNSRNNRRLSVNSLLNTSIRSRILMLNKATTIPTLRRVNRRRTSLTPLPTRELLRRLNRRQIKPFQPYIRLRVINTRRRTRTPLPYESKYIPPSTQTQIRPYGGHNTYGIPHNHSSSPAHTKHRNYNN